MSRDGRLERLCAHTWRQQIVAILLSGVYLTTLALAVNQSPLVATMLGSKVALLGSNLLMVLFAASSSVVARASVSCGSYEDLWTRSHGPFGLELASGMAWARFGDWMLWLSLLLYVLCVLTAGGIAAWLRDPGL